MVNFLTLLQKVFEVAQKEDKIFRILLDDKEFAKDRYACIAHVRTS